MRRAWQTQIIFWAAIFASCVWLALAIAVGVAGIHRFFAGGFKAPGHGPIEILIVSGFTLQPVLILLLIIRAVRLRDAGSPMRIVARALYPLAPAILLVGYARALQYLDFQSETRKIQRWSIGSITYNCSTSSLTLDYDPKTIGKIELRLTEFRHPGKLGKWVVGWPGKKLIEARSFSVNTGSIGGSQGIEWKEPDGRRMIAYLSFSDIMGEYGPAGIWITLLEDDVSGKFVSPTTTPSTKFTCGPNPASYHE